MEIQIRTFDEVRANRVRIEVAAGEQAEILVDGAPMFSQDELIKAQASEGELISRALTADLEKVRAELREMNAKYLELDAVRDDLVRQTRDLKRDFERERQSHRYDSERLNARLATVVAERETFKEQAYRENDEAARLRLRVRDLERQRAELHAVDGLWDRQHKLAEQDARTPKSHYGVACEHEKYSSDRCLGCRSVQNPAYGAPAWDNARLARELRDAEQSAQNARADFQRKNHQIRTLEVALMEARLAAKPETLERISQAVRALFSAETIEAMELTETPVSRKLKHAVESARDALSPFAPQDTTSQA